MARRSSSIQVHAEIPSCVAPPLRLQLTPFDAAAMCSPAGSTPSLPRSQQAGTPQTPERMHGASLLVVSAGAWLMRICLCAGPRSWALARDQRDGLDAMLDATDVLLLTQVRHVPALSYSST